MKPLTASTIALLTINVTALSTWATEELYFRSVPAFHVVLALVLASCVLLAPIIFARFTLGEFRTVLLLRFVMLVALAYLVLRLPANAGWFSASNSAFRAVAACVISALLIRYGRISESVWQRAVRAVLVGCAAFVVAPVIWRQVAADTVVWNPVVPTAQASAGSVHNKVIVIFDELGDTASAPIVQVLKQQGLEVATSSLKPAGPSTLMVIPSMLTGLDFSEAMVCGLSSICSGSHALDFSKIRAGQSDIDVVGWYHPYCEIQGLRFCNVALIPHQHGNTFRSLADLYMKKLGHPLPDLRADAERAYGVQNNIVRAQLDAARQAPFWQNGGVLYLHLAMPHPPGLTLTGKLDSDYAGNIDRSAEFTQELVKELRSRFDDDWALLITSDHPLRSWWCNSPHYRGTDCSLRPEFQTKRVPIIVASRKTLPSLTIESNAQIFGWF